MLLTIIVINTYRDLDVEVKAEIAKTDSWLQSAEEGDQMTLNSENCKYCL